MVVCIKQSLICLLITSSPSSLCEEGGYQAEEVRQDPLELIQAMCRGSTGREHQQGGTPTSPTTRRSYSQGSTVINPCTPLRPLRYHKPD
ncbi:hypothetical protein GQ55_5G430200 [Panicum hallii var. hallii]|uniref:Secreted protein n=1 Tax=Panicum hallii var. hallii TaxID=1504633 RepID=A0A2T7DPC4_9POAL|nr:hypothetical protein GQ55_5G430200 [Panicum hallii var. hallii]